MVIVEVEGAALRFGNPAASLVEGSLGFASPPRNGFAFVVLVSLSARHAKNFSPFGILRTAPVEYSLTDSMPGYTANVA